MKQNFYRVGNYLQNEIVLDSNTYNYGKSFTTANDYFLDRYFNIATKIDLPVDFLVYVNNGIAMYENDYLHEKIAPAIVQEFYIELSKVTNNSKYKDIVMPIKLINEFITSFDGHFALFQEGNYLWEIYFEMVRQRVFPNLPDRKKSIFLFENIEDCEYYIKKPEKNFGKIYEVEILEEKALFKGDMNIFEEIDLSITHNNLIKELFRYWNSEVSEKPIYEYLLQGKCKLKNIT